MTVQGGSPVVPWRRTPARGGHAVELGRADVRASDAPAGAHPTVNSVLASEFVSSNRGNGEENVRPPPGIHYPAGVSRPPTETLIDIDAGRSVSGAEAAELFDRLYDELRRIARRQLAKESVGHTLEPTGLVHEAWIRLVEPGRVGAKGRTHFLNLGAKVMHQLILDHARARGRDKRGGSWHRISLEAASSSMVGPETTGGGDAYDVEVVDTAIERMRALDPRQADVVCLRVFGGLTADEVAAVLGVSRRTVMRDWTMGIAWLRAELAGRGGKGENAEDDDG